jgi:hypothetical protein
VRTTSHGTGDFLVRVCTLREVRRSGSVTIPMRPNFSFVLSRHPAGPDFSDPTPGYGNQVVTDFWDEKVSADFEAAWQRSERGAVWSKQDSK